VSNFIPNKRLDSFLTELLTELSGKKQTFKFCQKHIDKKLHCHVIAIGKASVSMTVGLLDYLKISPQKLLCISKQNHLDNELQSYLDKNPSWNYLESSHPVMDESSLVAGEQLINFVTALDKNTPLVMLISGGTSALVEALPIGVSLDFLQALNQYLLASGLGINEINQVRKRFSLIKDGRLATHLSQINVVALYISDVPNSDVSVIGSGLLKKSKALPPVALPKAFDFGLPIFERKLLVPDTIEHHVIFDCKQALQLAKNLLSDKKVYVHPQLLFETLEQTQKIILEIHKQQPDYDVYLFGGECTVTLPDNAGKGGRNQHLALSMAKDLSSVDPLLFLSLGTDGTDGETPIAGAWVDNQTVINAKKQGVDIALALKKASSYQAVSDLGLTIKTGATGSNVMDLMILFRL
jgi:hydroxypyruvate reductase